MRQHTRISRPRRMTVALTLTLAALAALPLLGGSASALVPSPRCFITAGGTVDGDRFGGHAASYRRRTVEGGQQVDGRWTHTTADGRRLRGDIDGLFCRRNGGDPERPAVDFSVADFHGRGTFDGEPVVFGARVQDHGEPGDDDRYHIAIEGLDGTVIYMSGGILDSGNVQIHPVNFGHP